jgi:DNA polymerase III delta subunit
MTAITEQTRNASKSANALKTLGARLRGLDDEGEEIVDLVPKLASQFKALGIEMNDADGQVKSTYELTKSLAEVWPTLTDNQKTYMAELAAG